MNTRQPSRALSNGHINEGVDQFRLIVEAVLDYAIFMLDIEGRIVTWNAGAERIKGYKASEIIGRHFSVFYPSEEVQAHKPEWELEVAQREGRFEDEGWRIRKDGSRFWANVIITAIRDHEGNLLGYGKVTRDFTERRQHEQRLIESEERFRLLVESVPDCAIFMMSPEGQITTWNKGAERIKGYAAAEIIGKHYSIFFPQQDVMAGKPQRILETAAREGHAEQEGWRIRKDGSRFWVNALITALHDKSGKLIGFSKITRDVTERMEQQEALKKEMAERQKAQEALASSEQSLRRLSLNLLRTQDEERRRIGREMHDSLGQYLSVLKMKIETLRLKDAKLSAESSKELTICSALLEDCVKEVRTISYLLYPPMLEEMGLKSAISWYLEGFGKRSGIRTSLEVTSEFGRVSRDVELALFRVLQEGLTNVHKHSASREVDINLSQNSGGIVMEIRDYGKGVPQAVLDEIYANGSGSLGVGLRGMNERMRQLGGRLTVSGTDPGTRVRAEVPNSEASQIK